MQPFSTKSRPSQVAALRIAARKVLANYPIDVAAMRLVNFEFNAKNRFCQRYCQNQKRADLSRPICA